MTHAFDLSGSRIMITGAASGIGAATARICAEMGAATVLVDKNDCTEVANAIRAHAGRAEPRRCDVAKRFEVETLVAACAPIDALVVSSAICPWDDWDDAGWDQVFQSVIAVNLLGPMHLARAALPGMMAKGGGSIVMVGSLAGRSGGLIASPHYVAAKGGLHALVRWLALRAAPGGVVVNGVAPASVRTPMMQGQSVDVARIPLGRMAEPDEIGWPIAFLCSRAASFMTGTILDINGGVLMA